MGAPGERIEGTYGFWVCAGCHVLLRPIALGPEVRRLAGLPCVLVTGRVPDVRPYVAHADVSVSPLHLARGIHNKVLEAMALGSPVVVSAAACEGVRAEAGRDLLAADGAGPMAAVIGAILDGAHPGLGAAGRAGGDGAGLRLVGDPGPARRGAGAGAGGGACRAAC
ncbi:MAG: glycosyltransferase [Acetobacteraceae bacterium]